MKLQLKDFLQAAKDDLLIQIQNSNEDMFLFKYKGSLADWSNDIILNSRGIVFHKNGDLVIRPYFKFFNYKQYDWMAQQKDKESIKKIAHISSQEQQNKIQKLCQWPKQYNDIRIFEKLDGSLMNVSIYNNEIITTSSGSIDGIYPNYFKKALYNHLCKLDLIDIFKKELTGYTACFEYINTIVDPHIVKYDEQMLVLHGIIHNETGRELTFNEVNQLSDLFQFKKPIVFNNVKCEKDAINLLNQLENTNAEGFVAAFDLGNGYIHRLKFKTQSYLLKHDIYSVAQSNSISFNQAKSIYEMIENDTIDDVLNHFDLSDLSLKFIADISAFRDRQIKVFNELLQYKQSISNFDEKIKDHQFKKEVVQYLQQNYEESQIMLIAMNKLSNEQLSKFDSSQHFIQLWINRELKNIVKKYIQSAI